MRGRVTPHGQFITSRAKALLAARVALEKQAEGVVVMDLRALSAVTDFFVICTAGSGPQIAALNDQISAVLEQHGCAVWHTEGASGSKTSSRGTLHDPRWVLMDCGDVVVHVLDQQTRAFYQLEQLWADAPRLSVDDDAEHRPSATQDPQEHPARPGSSR